MSITPINILINEIKNYEFPETVINNIQKYMKNDIAYEVIQKHYGNLYDKKDLYEKFILNNYVFPKCYCNGCPNNGCNKLFKRKDCNYCFIFQYTSKYIPTDFEICIEHNPQFENIKAFPVHKEIEYDEDYYDSHSESYEYDESY